MKSNESSQLRNETEDRATGLEAKKRLGFGRLGRFTGSGTRTRRSCVDSSSGGERGSWKQAGSSAGSWARCRGLGTAARLDAEKTTTREELAGMDKMAGRGDPGEDNVLRRGGVRAELKKAAVLLVLLGRGRGETGHGGLTWRRGRRSGGDAGPKGVGSGRRRRSPGGAEV